MDEKQAQEMNALEQAAFNDPVNFLNTQQDPRKWTLTSDEIARSYSITPAQLLHTEDALHPKKWNVAETLAHELWNGSTNIVTGIAEGIANDKLNQVVFRSSNMTKEDGDRLVEDVLRSQVLSRNREQVESARKIHDPWSAGIGSGVGSVLSMALVGWATKSPAVVGALTGVGEAYNVRNELIDRYVDETGSTEGVMGQMGKYNALASAYGLFSGAVEASIGVERLAAGSLNRYGKLAALQRLARQKGEYGKALAYKTGREVVASGAEEFGEEFLQSIGEDVAISLAQDMWTDPDIKKALTQGMFGAIIGAPSGAIFYNGSRKKIIDYINKWNKDRDAGLTDGQVVQMTDEILGDGTHHMLDEVTTRVELQQKFGKAFETVKDRIGELVDATGVTPWVDENKTKEQYIQDVAYTITAPMINKANIWGMPLSEFLDVAQMNITPTATGFAPILNFEPIASVDDLKRLLDVQNAIIKEETDASKIGNANPDRKENAQRRKAILQYNIRAQELANKRRKQRIEQAGIGGDIQNAQDDVKHLKDSPTQADFIGKLSKKAQGSLKDNSGKVSKKKSQDRYQNALLKWVAGNDDELFEKIMLDKTVSQKVIDVLATHGSALYELDSQYPDLGIREDLYHALKKMQVATKDNFLEITQWVENRNVMPENVMIWNWLYADVTTNREFMGNYILTLRNNVENVNAGEDIFGDKNAPLSKKDALIQALKKTDETRAQLSAERGREYESLFTEIGEIRNPELSAAVISYNNQFGVTQEEPVIEYTDTEILGIFSKAIINNKIKLNNWENVRWSSLLSAGDTYQKGKRHKPATEVEKAKFARKMLDKYMPGWDRTTTPTLQQFDLADENARLDDIYPEYTGDTIRIIDPAELKQAQYEVIQRTNPMQDEYHVGIRSVNDIKTFDETIDDKDSFVWGDYSQEDAKRDLAKNEITIYSSKPIENGVFVSTSYRQAQEYAGGKGAKVYKKTVPLDYVAWISGDEGQFAITDVVGKKRSVYNSNGERIAQSEPALRNFYKWFGDSKVVDEQGRPLVVYHGSTRKFVEFDISKSSKESNLGAGFYFTDNEEDVSSNYEGGGADFDNRVERLAEQIEQEEGIDYEEARIKAYEQEFAESTKYDVYLKMEKPFVIGGKNETVLTFEEKYNEETDEYEEPTGTLLDFAYALDNELADLGIDDYKISTALFERAAENGGTITANEINELLDGDEQLSNMLLDYGNESTGQLLSDAVGIEYDGFIDHTVSKKFGSERNVGVAMAGVDSDTTHYIAFNSNQIKSVDNRGTYSDKTGNIYLQSAYAGSRVDYDKPSLEAISSGQGTEAHGWGLYYTLNPDIADMYRKIATDDFSGDKKLGQVHEVDIPEMDVLLDEQKPLNQQNIKVIKALGKIAAVISKNEEERQKPLVEGIKQKLGEEAATKWMQENTPNLLEKRDIAKKWAENNSTGREIYDDISRSFNTGITSAFDKESDKKASQLLDKYGVKGISYYSETDGNAFVIFNSESVKVLRKKFDELGNVLFQKRGVIRGFYDPELQAIVLGKHWNETTLVHEFHHRYLEKIWGIYQQAQQGVRTVSPEFMDDVSKLFEMLDIDPSQQQLTTVQQEKFASMVEAYITGLGVDNPENLAFQTFMHWIPEKYKSIMDIGYLDENGLVKNPILDEASIDFFNKWFASPFAPSLPSAPDAQRMVNVTDDKGEIIPSNQKVMNNREKEWGQDSEEQLKADAQLYRAIGENNPSNLRAALDGEEELMKAESKNLDDDRILPEKPKLRDKWFKTRQKDARTLAADKAREYLEKNPEHARELAFADPETMTEFDAPVDHGMLIRAVMETVGKGSDEWYILDNNLAMIKSMSGSTLSLSGDLSHQAYLDAKREVENARELKAAVNYAGTRQGAMDKWNSDIRAFAARRVAAIMATEPNSEERKTAIKAFLEEAKTKFSGNTTNAILNQLDLTGVKTKSSQVFIKWAEKQIKEAAHAKIDTKEQAELMKASVKAQLALRDIDSTELKDGQYARAIQSSKDIRHWQFVKDKMKKAYIGRWGKFGIFWDNLLGGYMPSAMLMSVNTLFFANVPSNVINTGIVRRAARHIGENKVDSKVTEGEIKRIKQIFNASGMNLAQMEKPSSPSTLHGEKYMNTEQAHWYNFTFEILGKTDNLFRIPTFVDALARIATKDAGGDKAKATVLFKEYIKLNNTTEEAKIARKQALAVANMAVFTQDGTMASGLNHIRSQLNNISRGLLGLEPGGFGLGNILAPFLKTGANIAEMGIKATFAPVRQLVQWGKKAAGKEIPELDKLAMRVDWTYFAWTCVATALMAAITSDDDEWYIEPYESGKQYDPDRPYDSIKISGVWLKLDVLGVFAIPLRTSAMLVKDWETRKLGALGDGMLEALSDTPLVNQFTDSSLGFATRKPGKWASTFAYNQVNKLFPAQLKTVTKATSRATDTEWDVSILGPTIERKFHRNYGLDGERLTTNDLILLLTNRLKTNPE